MARRIGQDMVVELNWETLLGVDKEPREIRDLCARRGADRYLVFTDDVGLRTAGLATGLERDEHGADTVPAYALAGILAGRCAGRPLVFLHALDDTANKTLLIAVKAGRPDIDRVLPMPDALREAERFIETLEEECRLCGTHSVSGKNAEPMPLPDGATLSDAERNAYRIARLHAGFTRRAPTRRTRRRAACAVAAVIVGAGVGLNLLGGRRADEPAPRAAVPPDPVATHRERVARVMARELAAPGSSHAARMVALLGELPVEVARWRMSRMRCAEDGCEILWRRRPGGTLDGLLDARPAAMPSEQDVDQALERLALPDDPKALPALTLRRRDVFYRMANSRTQRLRDAGLAMEWGPTTPVVSTAIGKVAPASAPPPTPTKGPWTMSGHLAFIDSVPGLLRRTGNMSVRELLVEIDPAPSRFRAAGEFYVE